MMDTAAPPAVRVRQMSRDSTDGTTTPEEDRGVTLVRDMFTHIEASGIRLLEIFFSVDTQGKGDLNLHEFSEALARMCFEASRPTPHTHTSSPTESARGGPQRT